jgi:hypothetical protein
VTVDTVTPTTQWEKVYNLRVADFHTYFVGKPEWGFSVWAHNSYEGFLQKLGFDPEIIKADAALNPKLRAVYDYAASPGATLAGLRDALKQQGLDLPRLKGSSVSARRDLALEEARRDLAQIIFNAVEIPQAHVAQAVHKTAAGLDYLPVWSKGNKELGLFADPAHGYLVVGKDLYLIRSTGPNGKASYAFGLVPRGSIRLGLGFTSKNQGHVEASAAALLRKLKSTGVDVSEATLVVNLAPCLHSGKGCRPNLPGMLPEGTKLQVFARNVEDNSVYSHPFTGLPD